MTGTLMTVKIAKNKPIIFSSMKFFQYECVGQVSESLPNHAFRTGGGVVSMAAEGAVTHGHVFSPK